MAKKKTVTQAVPKSKKYDTIKEYYDTGRWKIESLRHVVAHGWITPEEFTEITGEPYEVQ